MQPFKPFLVHGLIALAFLGSVGAIGAGLVVYFGLYNVAAVDQHTSPVYAVLDYALAQAIRQRAKGIEPPADLSDPSRTDTGFMLFRKHCVGCHGAPGIPPGDAGKGMLPHPTNLVESARGLRPEEIFWVVKNGIKMTGMPAWQFRFSDPEIWAIVAFLRQLPSLSADEYRALEWEASSVVPLTAPCGSLR